MTDDFYVIQQALIYSVKTAYGCLPQKVFMCYPYNEEEKFICHGISTGLACGSSYNHATLSSVCEVVERDSFMLTWLLKLPGVLVDIDACQTARLMNLYSHIQKHLIGSDELYIFDISRTKGIYTILAFIRNEIPGAYGLIVSASSHLNPEIATCKALEELCQTQKYAYSTLMTEKDTIQDMSIQEIDTLHKHMLYYGNVRRNTNIDFIFGTEGKKVCLSTLENYSCGTDDGDVDYLTTLFRNLNQDVFIVDVTLPEYRLSGFIVLKAVIPSYLELDVTQKLKQFNNPRLAMLQKKYSIQSINQEPHPFP